jgi:hypothetical protein
VREKSGKPCALRPSLVRNLVRFVDGVGFYVVGAIAVGLSLLKQRVGDRFAGTVVVQNARRPVVRLCAGAICAAILYAGFSRLIHSAKDLDLPLKSLKAIPAAEIAANSGRLRAGNFKFMALSEGTTHAPVYKPGESVQIKYEVIGFSRDAHQTPDVILTSSVTDPSGIRLSEPKKARFHEPSGATERIAASFSEDLPDFAPSGDYKFNLTVRDQLDGAELAFKPTFHVNGVTATTAGLTIHEVFLSLTSDGPAADPLLVKGAAKIFAHFTVSGLAVADGHVNARVAEKVTSASGRTILNNHDLLELKDSVAYHPATFGIPIISTLSIPKGFDAGTYRMEFLVVDNLSGQSTQANMSFVVD